MAKHTRLHRRKNSRNYQFRAKVPIDLQDHYGKKEIKFSLRTGDYREALEKVRIESVKLDQEFATARRKLSAVGVPGLSFNEIKRLAAISYHNEMKEDENRRRAGLSEKDYAEYAELLDTLESEGRERLSRGDTRSIEEYAEELLTDQGITLDKNSEDFKRLAIKLLESFVKANKAMRERNQGKVIQTPPKPLSTEHRPSGPPQ